jgi:hypothetical protein
LHQLTRSPGLPLILLSSVLLLGGCDDDCVEVDTSCDPLYEPTFENVYNNTLAVSCAVGNGTCHTSDGQATAGGLAFTSQDAAYDALENGRVEAGDASCSLIVERIAATDDADVMPPGSPLSEAERCSIIQWIEAGAPR